MLRSMSAALKAPDWFLTRFGMTDGFFTEDRTAVVGHLPGIVGLPLLAQGLSDTPYPKATVELEKVLPAITQRLADEGYITTGRAQTYEPKLRLVLEPAPDEALRSPAFQSDLAKFREGLTASGMKFSSRHFTQDAIATAGWSLGEITLLISTLGPTAIVQLRKLLDTYLKARAGGKLKLKYGPLTLEGSAEDVEKLITPEQIEKLLTAPHETTALHKTSKKTVNE